MDDLFESFRPVMSLAEGAVWLPGFAREEAGEFLQQIEIISACAPFRKMRTPGGRSMSVATTSCGTCGWYSDAQGYRYLTHDPLSKMPWPEMPEIFRQLARRAAERAGYPDFTPSSCLINRYEPGAGMGLHQDRDEDAPQAPIVSVSLGVPARFSFGGPNRENHARRIELLHGDVVVWGGASRFAWHGVSPLRETFHPSTKALRYNLTFRAINISRFQS